MTEEVKTQQKVKVNGSKKIVVIIVTLTLLTGFYFMTFGRYDIKGTNQGYIFKTDRLTGKTEAVSPYGNSKDKSTAMPFPLEQLEIVATNAEWDELIQRARYKITLKNTSMYIANNIEVKLEYKNEENGPVMDTVYKPTVQTIRPGDTVVVEVQDYKREYSWFLMSVVSADTEKL